MESSKQIEDRAAAWLAHRDSGNWTATDQAQLAEWLNASAAHRVAFLRLEAGWEKSSRLKVFGVGAKPGEIQVPGRWQLSAFFKEVADTTHASVPHAAHAAVPDGRTVSGIAKPQASVRYRFAIAATILLTIGAGTYLTLHARGDRYTTPLGGVASIPLRDGSQITLNTASKIRVALTDAQRHVELETGEAYFNVAKDPTRPFIVAAGNRRIIAVGTQFSVRRNADLIDVIVTEGTVRIEPSGLTTQASELLSAGAIAHAGPDEIRVRNKPLSKIEESLSWRAGYLTFDEATLADAVAEFNRYNTQKIYIEDPKLEKIRISGKFRATNSTDFIHLLRTGFAIQTRQTDDSTYLAAN